MTDKVLSKDAEDLSKDALAVLSLIGRPDITEAELLFINKMVWMATENGSKTFSRFEHSFIMKRIMAEGIRITDASPMAIVGALIKL